MNKVSVKEWMWSLMTTQDQGQTTATLRSLNMPDVLIAKQDFLIQASIDRFNLLYICMWPDDFLSCMISELLSSLSIGAEIRGWGMTVTA